ncbi:MAG: 30S ribosomal protein S24e [Promethearchaeota archaeon]
MSFDIKILEEKKNPLIERTELTFRVDHFGSGTPNRLELKKKISKMKKSNEKLTVIKKVKTHFGSAFDIGVAYIYKDAKELQYFEPFHIQARNLEKEKRAEIHKLKKRNEPFKQLFEYK